MQRKLHFLTSLSMAAAAFSAACTVSTDDDKKTAAADSAVVTPAPPAVSSMPLPADSSMPAGAATVSNLSIEVDLSARKLQVLGAGDTTATYSVAVGSQRWPTETGQWRITQVVWNPEWIPPDESWAEQREPRKPGDPKNPLGRVQLVYDPPRTIHGTPERASIGKAISHGSIRMYNEDAAKLGRQLMEATGVGKDESFYQNVEKNRTEKVVVDLPGGVPIRVF